MHCPSTSSSGVSYVTISLVSNHCSLPFAALLSHLPHCRRTSFWPSPAGTLPCQQAVLEGNSASSSGQPKSTEGGIRGTSHHRALLCHASCVPAVHCSTHRCCSMWPQDAKVKLIAQKNVEREAEMEEYKKQQRKVAARGPAAAADETEAKRAALRDKLASKFKQDLLAQTSA
ncbi:hypothetical protein V8C86DRAFT_1688439 [Haematococcus lacustris]